MVGVTHARERLTHRYSNPLSPLAHARDVGHPGVETGFLSILNRCSKEWEFNNVG
jgi:hypothetical protein